MNANAKKRYKDIDYPFMCPVSKREFNSSKGLSVYLTKTLKMDHSSYYDTYINHRDSSCFFCNNKGVFISVGKGYRNLCNNEECIKKSFNSHSIEGFMYRNLCTKEEGEILFKNENDRQLKERIITQNKLRLDDIDWDKRRSRNCKEFWIKKGFTYEESEQKVKEVMNEIHEKTFKKFNDNPEKYASKYITKVEYWLKKGFTKEESVKKISERQSTFSLDICIKKYGKEDGILIFQERQEKWQKTLDSKTDEEKIEINRKKMFNNSGYSKISQKMFWEIYKLYDKNNINFEELNGEVIRYDKVHNRHYRYDYVDFTKKIVIEYNGDFWHCNPEQYESNHIHKIMNVSASYLWEKEKIKKEWMEKRGYDVLTIWDSEYRKNPQQTLDKCIKFLNNK
jgi:very-short-patch-repair endonuclease